MLLHQLLKSHSSPNHRYRLWKKIYSVYKGKPPKSWKVGRRWGILDVKGFMGLWSGQPTPPSLRGPAGPSCDYKYAFLSLMQTFLKDQVVFYCRDMVLCSCVLWSSVQNGGPAWWTWVYLSLLNPGVMGDWHFPIVSSDRIYPKVRPSFLKTHELWSPLSLCRVAVV